MAGAEAPGPELASATLFVGRPWLLCPGSASSAAAVSAAKELALACGAHVVELTADEHDRTVALVSHLPQVAASALASMLRDREAEVALSGPGLRDTTRIAGSDPALWLDLLLRSAPHLAPLVGRLAEELALVARALAAASAGGTELRPRGSQEALDRRDQQNASDRQTDPAKTVAGLLEHGREGRALIPVKRGGTDRDFAIISVSVPDEPGRLAALLGAVAQVGVNVEDVTVEHLPGRPTGVISVSVTAAQRSYLDAELRQRGWSVLGRPARTS